MIIVVTHSYLINKIIVEPPTPTIIETLISLKKDFIFLRHSMNGDFESALFTYKNGTLVSNKKIFSFKRIAPVRYISQIIATIAVIMSLKDKLSLFLGISPLNAFTGLILKKLGKVGTTIFYSTDFTDKRFDNHLLNRMYLAVDKTSTLHSDYVWNVSTRIQSMRSKLNIPEKKNLFVPNVPSDEYLKYISNKRNKFHLITLGVIGDQLDFINIFITISRLKNRYKNLLLKIAGSGPKENEYKQYVKTHQMEKNVKFLGHLDHEHALEEISTSGIGLALYNGNWNFNYYGDSMKCREFFSFGLPVITTDTHSTAEEIKKNKAGIIVKMNSSDYEKALICVLKDYDNFSKNSLNLGIKYKGIHSKLLKDY